MDVSPVSVTEHVSAANQVLTNVRVIRDQLVSESADANRRLSEAVLAVVTHKEKIESASRLLALADACIGQIRARMRVHGIPIYLPSMSSDVVTPISDASKETIQG